MNKVKTPWAYWMGSVPMHLDYFQGTMVEMVEGVAERCPNVIACDFMGGHILYPQLVSQIHRCAQALRQIGIQPGERVTICMPNAPQTVVMFYAVNMVGAIANMVHPLSAEGEIEFYLNDSESVAALTLDQFYGKFANIRKNTPCLKHLIIADVADALNPLMKVGYKLTAGRKIPKVPKDADVMLWKQFMENGKAFRDDPRIRRRADDPAVILYSGGTTGITKGILLSNLNFNALAAQIIATNPIYEIGDKMLAIMPMFHGFGLGVSIHSMLANGGRCILVPRFTPQTYAELLRKHKPNFIAGVPTLYEALLRIPNLENLDLSCLKGVFSGGDSLPIELKRRFDAFLKAHGAKIEVREGYGTTECVTASCLTPLTKAKEGSIGIPFPDTYYKIVRVGGEEEVPYGEEGEICLAGPTVMLEYVKHPQETAQTRRVHADGMTWIHTGDLGVMDSEGYIYFRQRIKRMIVTSGYNVYPSQIENILDAHEAVHMSCVIGVRDPYKMQKVKAYIVLKPGFEPSEATREMLMDYCRKHIAKYALPYDIEFRADLPKTLVGKVAYRVLEEEMAQNDPAGAVPAKA